MARTFSPQFLTHNLDLNLRKGSTAKLVVTIAGTYDFNVQNSLIFTEVRKEAPGYLAIDRITASTATGSPAIKINAYPLRMHSTQILSMLPIQAGDLITVEGSGIEDSKVLSVSSAEIIVSNNATASISNSRISHRSLPLTSFRAEPVSSVMNLVCNEISENPLTVTGITSSIPVGTELVFTNVSNQVTTRTVTQTALAGATTLYVSGTGGTSGTAYFCKIGPQVITLTQPVTSVSTSATFSALSYQIPANTVLHFATKGAGNSKDGWRYQGSFKTAANTTPASNQVNINSIQIQKTSIPSGSVALFSTIKSNQFRLILDTLDNLYIPTGTYKYDTICRFPDGEVIRILEGNCTFSDNWSDL